MLPKVSVIVPVYNVEKYLRQCLDSIVCQTLENIEIICVNDGSTDNSYTILKEYANKDSRIQIIDKDNSGYGHSMNLGIQRSTGEYIGIVESDDFAKPEMFEVLYNIATSHDLDVARCLFSTFKQRDGSIKKIDASDIKSNVLINPQNDLSLFFQWPSVWANIYKRSFIQQHNLKFCICYEFEEIITFCKNNSLYEKLKFLICYLQYKTYKWNYNRLEMPYRYLFLLYWSKQIKKNKYLYSKINPYFAFKDIKKIQVIKLLPLLYKYCKRL